MSQPGSDGAGPNPDSNGDVQSKRAAAATEQPAAPEVDPSTSSEDTRELVESPAEQPQGKKLFIGGISWSSDEGKKSFDKLPSFSASEMFACSFRKTPQNSSPFPHLLPSLYPRTLRAVRPAPQRGKGERKRKRREDRGAGDFFRIGDASGRARKKGRLRRRRGLGALLANSPFSLPFLLSHRSPLKKRTCVQTQIQKKNLPEKTVMRDRVTRNSRGFGFVTFLREDEADAAAAASPHEVDGARVDAKESVPSEPRGGAGGWGEAGSSSSTSLAAQNRAKKVFVGGLASATSTGEFSFFFSFSISLGRRRPKGEKKNFFSSFFFLCHLKILIPPTTTTTTTTNRRRVPRVLQAVWPRHGRADNGRPHEREVEGLRVRERFFFFFSLSPFHPPSRSGSLILSLLVPSFFLPLLSPHQNTPSNSASSPSRTRPRPCAPSDPRARRTT